jgi:hypothetical protein
MKDKNLLLLHFKKYQGKKDAICEEKACRNEKVTTMQHHLLCRERIVQLVNLKNNKM